MANLREMEKISFPSQRKANEFIEKYESEMLIKRGYAPVRAYFNDTLQTWQVTSRYNVSGDYYGTIISTFERETGRHLPYPHTDQQHRKHVDDALLYYMDCKIYFIAKSLCENMEGEFLLPIINEIRVAHSLSDYRKEGWNESHKEKIAKFISCWTRWKAGQISDEACRNYMTKALDYFGRKVQSFAKKDQKTKDESHSEVKELQYCIKQIKTFHYLYELGEIEGAKICLMKAYKAFESISQDTQCTYKRKMVKNHLLEGFETLIAAKQSA